MTSHCAHSEVTVLTTGLLPAGKLQVLGCPLIDLIGLAPERVAGGE